MQSVSSDIKSSSEILDSKDHVKALINSHKTVLSRLQKDKFIIDPKDNIVELPAYFLMQLFDKLKQTNEIINLSEILQNGSELDIEIANFIKNYSYSKEMREVEGNKNIGLAFPCFTKEDKERKHLYYVAARIYPLELRGNNTLTLKCEKVERNEDLEGKIETLLTKVNRPFTFEHAVGIDILKDLIGILGVITNPLVIVANLGLTLYGALQCHKRLHQGLVSGAEKEGNKKTENEKIAILLSYEDTRFITNAIRDYDDINEKFSKFSLKLSKLFKRVDPPNQEAIKREYITKTFTRIDRDIELQESQLRNYGRMLLQDILAIEGPPGTGKTQLLAQFCLDRIFENFLNSFEEKGYSHTILVTSTNNKAVDNVFKKLEDFDKTYCQKESLTGRYIKGYMRVGAQQINNKAKEELLQLLTDINQEEISKNKARLKEEILPLSVFVRQYKNKQENLFTKESKLKELQDKTRDMHVSRYEIEKKLYELADRLFTNRQIALDFNKENLTTFNQIMAGLRRPWIIYCLFQKKKKERLYTFATEKGLRLSGLDDFKYLSIKEVFRRNSDFHLSLSEFFETKEKLAGLTEELERVEREINTFQEEIRKLSIEIEEAKKDYEEKVLLLFNRLQEYQFWKVIGDTKVKEELKSFQANGNFWSLKSIIPDIAPVVICTALSVRNIVPPDEIFETVIVDEGSQTLLTYTLPLYLRGRRFVVTGDTNQLGPIQKIEDDNELQQTFSDIPDHLNYKRSIMETVEYIDRTEPLQRRLLEHYRSRRGIIQFCNELVGYGLEIKTKDEPYQLGGELPDSLKKIFDNSVTFINIMGNSERLLSGSKLNIKESEFIIRFLKDLSPFIDPKDIAVITPYRAQADRIIKSLPKDYDIVVGTVHQLQGDERDIVLISAVDSDPKSFLKSPLWDKRELVNVAVSRARKHLIVVGNEGAIKNINDRYSNISLLYNYIAKNGILLNSYFADRT